jgi:8-oxo-dGTP pyrophosphatase MutT (NUDIX family)
MNEARGNIRNAASVLVLRDGACGVEVLLMRRPERDNDFRSGACVFPGGVLDRSDVEAHPWCFGVDDAGASARLGQARGGLDYFVAALRECFEEVGLLFVCHADGRAVDLFAHASALQGWRSRLHRGEATIAQLCAAFDWRLDLREMAYFSHWLTPVTRPKRFDTRFFVRLAPPGQVAQPDMGEALELMWLTPDEALDPARGLKLLNVTQRTLHDLRSFATAQAAFAHALAKRGVARIFPRPALGRAGPRFVIEADPAYEEVAKLDPDGRGDVRCELRPGDVVQLSARLWRVSGATHNAYLVSDSAGSEWAVIDFDTADEAQLMSLRDAAKGSTHWCLSTGALADPLPLPWPTARRVPHGAALVRLGADSTLRRLAEVGAVLLEEEHTLIGGTSPATDVPAGTRIDWHAPAAGFLVRLPGR